MDHDAVREVLDLAAAEPGGLDRLMAGDTATAAAVAAHLVGCEACTAELERLRQVSGLVREVIVTTPAARPAGSDDGPRAGARRPRAGPPAIATEGPRGRRRGAASRCPRRHAVVRRCSAGWPRSPRPSSSRSSRPRSSSGARWTSASPSQDGRRPRPRRGHERHAPGDRASPMPPASPWKAPLARRPAARSSTRPARPSSSSSRRGSWSRPRAWSTGAGSMIGSGRERIGRMFFGGGLAYWVGPSAAVAGSTDATFGVSLVDASGAISGPDPVLVGET